MPPETASFTIGSTPGTSGIVGYSQGGAGAIRAVTEYANSDIFTTIFTGSAPYATLSKNMGWEYEVADVSIPYFMTAGTGLSDGVWFADPESQFGGVSPLSSQIENYNAISDDVVKVRARAAGAEHTDMQERSEGYVTAWLRYRLHADPDAATVFLGEDAELLANPKWQDVEKNR